jgi:hypothetical protein
MAEITVPIQVNLPDDWVEQIIDRLQNDPEAEWVRIVRCKDCKYWREHKYAKETKRYIPFCGFNAIYTKSDDFCSRAERRTDDTGRSYSDA